MQVFLRVFLTVCFSLFICFNGYCSGGKGVVTKKMIDMARKLAVKAHSNGGQSKLDVTSTSIVEVGNNKGHGLPVKFQIKGQETYKDLEDYPPGYTGGFPILLRSTIDKKRQFNAVEVFRYSTDEFDKLVVCTDSGYTCLKEGEEVKILYRMETTSNNSQSKQVQEKTKIHKGKVVFSKSDNNNTFLKIDENGKDVWVAVPKTIVVEGDTIIFPDSPPFKNYISKALGMTFDEIIFAPSFKNLE